MVRQENRACHEFRDEGQVEADKHAEFWALFQFEEETVATVTGKQSVEDKRIKND